MSIISLVRSTSSYEGVTNALEKLGDELGKELSRQGLIVVKVNFVIVNKKLATTPVDTVRGFVAFARKYYSGKIIIAEEATAGDTINAMKEYGFVKLAEEDGNIEIVDSGKTDSEKHTIDYGKGSISLPVANIYKKTNYVVSITRAKTHDTVVVTLSLKNLLVGAIKHGFFKTRFKIHVGKRINQILAGMCDVVYPNLGIVDGVVGMEGQGPADGTPIESNWVAVSTDPLALDSLATFLMGFDIADVGYLNLIREKKMGTLFSKGKIEVVGEDPKKLVKKYKPHATFEKQKKWKG